MASPYAAGAGGGGGGGSVYAGAAGGAAAPSGGHHGVLGFIENVGADIKDAALGVPAGIVHAVEHPVGTAEQIAKSYEQTYGPLLHGHVSEFLHNFYQHPVGPLLDAATLFTGGGALLGKAGEIGLLGKAGENLGKAGTLELRNPAALAQAGRLKGLEGVGAQEGAATLTKATAANPARRLVQTKLDTLLKQLPARTPLAGEMSRFQRELDYVTRHGPRVLATKVNVYRKSYQQLNKWEQLAFHFHATAVTPQEYRTHLAAQVPAADTGARAAIQKVMHLLAEPKLERTYANPSARLRHALDEGRQLSAQLGEHHLEIARKNGAPAEQIAQLAQSFADRPFLHSRIVSGATHDEEGALVGGKTVEQLKAEGRNPFYLPDIAAGRPGSLFKAGGGVGIPKAEGALKQNQGILFNTARLAMNPQTLDQAFMAHTRFVLHDAIHDAFMQHAIRIPVGQGRPAGYVFIRQKAGERIPYTEKVQGDVLQRLHELIPEDQAYNEFVTQLPAEAAGAGKYRLVVPEAFAKGLAGEFSRSTSTLSAFWNKPTAVWRAIVLGLRPGFFTNNVVGNAFLLALHHAGPDGARGFLSFLREARGPDYVKRFVKKEAPRAPREFRQIMAEYVPEVGAGTFGRTQFPKAVPGGELVQKVAPKAARLAKGVGPATAKVAEDIPREISVRSTLSKVARERGMRIPTETARFNEMARQLLSDPAVARRAVDEANKALGDYLSLTSFEKGALRNIVPFYGWIRAISLIAAHAAVDTPGRVALISRLGQVGVGETQSRLGGVPLPDFLRGLVPLGATSPAGAHTVLSTQGLNPLSTIPQVLGGVGGILHGQAGATGKAATQIGLNPIFQAIVENLSGRQLFSGKPVTGAPGLPAEIVQNIVGGLPPVSLVQAARGQGRESKLYGKQSAREALLQFLGAPVKRLDLAQAHSYAP